MKYFYCLIFAALLFPVTAGMKTAAPVISDVTYSDIQLYSVRISWITDTPSDSKVRWMISDSLNENIVYTDSAYFPDMVTSHSVILNYLNTHAIYNFSVSSSNASGSSTTDNRLFATMAPTDGWVKVYFNKSVDTTVKTSVKADEYVNLEETLLNRITKSGFYIDACLSSFEDASSITHALIRAKQDDVVIRIIYDGKQNSNWLDTLIANGIQVLKRGTDLADGHGMHMNYWVFDARCTCSGGQVYVWNSSAEITHQSLVNDKNNAVEINDRTLAYIFTREFEEMWGAHGNYPNPAMSKFGSMKRDVVPHIVNLNGTYAEVYFSPSDSVEKRVRNMMTSSSSGIMFGSYDFKSQNIYNTLYSLRTSRNIRGIFDLINSPSGLFNSMKAWADVWADSTPGRLAHGYMLCDPLQNNSYSAVATGSYDWTPASNLNNDDNIMIFHSPVITNLYYQEFHQRYKDVTGHPVGISNISEEIPADFTLYQNYPNPFNAQTNIKFSLSANSAVSIKIYDALGKLAAEPVNGRYNPGTYNFRFDAGNFSSGIYFYVLKANGRSYAKKMTIIK
ncbi:MAG: phospholipase D-like domain-containing protein [Bacteroidetes bacterium]|nr:phospholipase D-like domain-containing protein [Bacteroidota bacterium]